MRGFLYASLAVPVLLLLGLLTPLPLQFLVRLLPDSNMESVDSIVVLGRGPESQLDRALTVAQYWKDHPTAAIFVSGMTDAPEIIGVLEQQGIPESRIRGERCSQSTWENGLFTEYLLDADTAKQIVLITDSPHMVRATWVFQGFGFEVVPYPLSSEQTSFFSLKQAQTIIREYIALIFYGFSGKFSPEPADQKQKSETQAKYKIDNWGCYLKE
jgi:uncharacterized SAM-binding protein YcdF (DUF218 family)